MTHALRGRPKSAILVRFMHRIKKLLQAKGTQNILLGVLCAIGAFTVGMETAGDVRPFSTSQAAVEEIPLRSGGLLRGDANGNGVLDVEDAAIILQASQGWETPAQDQVRRGDTDGDFRLTAKDALRILHQLSLRSR